MFKEAFPENFRAYEVACKSEQGPGRSDVRHGKRVPPRTAVDHQLPEQEALAAAFESGVDHRGLGRSAASEYAKRHQNDRAAAAGVREWRFGMGRGAAGNRTRARPAGR